MTDSSPSLGQRAYEAFSRNLLLNQSERLVSWAKLAPFARDAWEAAARAAVEEDRKRAASARAPS